MSRIVFALLAVVALTAFAPAPFPRRDARGRESMSPQSLAGNWRATRLVQTGSTDVRDPSSNGVSHVTITATQWVFNKNNSPTTYDLRLDPTKRPAEIDFLHANQKEAYGRGVIRREGNSLRVIYHWGSPRPTGFENQPAGYWDLTLQRE